jgi:hypothetical protein
MGLFDFFKKKDSNETPKSETPKVASPKSELFLAISKYNEYIVQFVGMQQGNYAPISAYEKPTGEIIGFLYVMGKDNSYTLSAEEVVSNMETNFEQKLATGEIKSYVILYHSQFANNGNHQLAVSDDELKAITVSYHFKTGEKGKIGLPYRFEDDSVTYQGFQNFNQEENNLIFTTKLKEGKDYFQDREEIQVPLIENEAGLKIKKANNVDLSNTWGGIFGFESYRKPNGDQALREHFALALTNGPVFTQHNIAVSQLDYEAVTLKGISHNGTPTTILPVIKTDYVVDVVNKEITEWENVDNLEAIITGTGRDTFGISYFATDYAENRALYLTKTELNIQISGIVFVLDISTMHQSEGELQYSEDFTMYMPSNDLPGYACFDFVGELEDFRETHLLEDNSLKGYLMNVRLITHADAPNFFTIDLFVTPENMRFRELKKGMKLTGMFQMQGQIAP